MSKNTKYFDTTVSAKPGDTIQMLPKNDKGELIPHVLASTIHFGLAKSFAGYQEILGDLKIGVDSLKAIAFDEQLTDRLKDALFISTTITYGRCFTAAEGRGTVLNESPPWIMPGTEEEKNHKTLMTFRNQLHAHAGDAGFRQTNVFVLVDNSETPTQFCGIFHYTAFLRSLDKEDAFKLSMHLNKVAERVQSKVSDIGLKLEAAAKDKFK